MYNTIESEGEHMYNRILVVVLSLVLLCGCANRMAEDKDELCHIVIEEGEGFTADSCVFSVERGSSICVRLSEAEGYTVTGTDYGDYTLERTADGLILTLQNIRYTKSVRVAVRKSDVVITYVSDRESVEQPVTAAHARLNTEMAIFSRNGYTLYAWNTRPDGSGESIGLGSRVDYRPGLCLYAQWAKWSDAALFSYEKGAITGYHGDESRIVIPAEIGGEAVHTIASGAFARCRADTVIFPQSIRTVEPGAFEGAQLRTLYLFDSIRSISDYSFDGCAAMETLHLNAATAPVYSGSYYAVFADKYDRLLNLRDRQKIILFSGSSARFGYDSALIDAAFSDYAVVNMGVFAYTNALPQMELIRECMQAGDILLLSPELDAAKRQFCTTNALDAPFFNLMEANYDMLSKLDLREYSLVFSSLGAYLSTRIGMEERSYALSPADYDEDGNPSATPSYNEYGDYILYRPNSESEEPLYALEVPYTPEFYRKELYIDPFNAELSRFTDQGIRVYMTYSPRNRLAVSKDSTEQSIEELDAYFRTNIEVPIISDLRDSLISGIYLSGTDNHLSTEGVRLRTERVIVELREQMEKEREHE